MNVGFDEIWDNLKSGAMGSVCVGYGRWALSTEVIYMDLEATTGPVTAKAQQWLVQPALQSAGRRLASRSISNRIWLTTALNQGLLEAR